MKKQIKKSIVGLPVRIFLIGFMGSGKTHWGRIWSADSGIPFFDLDVRIEKAFKITITAIFEKKGEVKFRELERLHLMKFQRKKNFILACGGGTPCFSDNMKWMKSQGMVFYLKASPTQIINHIVHETSHRPLLSDINPAELSTFIENKLIEREPYYSQADVILDVNELDNKSLSAFI